MKTRSMSRFAALATALGGRVRAGPAGYPADYAQTIAAANEGRQGRHLQRARHQGRAAADQGLQRALSRHQGRVQRHELDRALQPLHRRSRPRARVGRRDVELGDGPAGEARRRRPGARLRVAGGGEAAGVGGLQEPGLRHHLRAARCSSTTSAWSPATKSRRTTPPSPSSSTPRPTSSRARSRPTTSRRAAWASCSSCRTRSTSRGMKELEKGFGAVELHASTPAPATCSEKVSSGEHLLGYNMLGSYALVRAKKDPNARRRAAEGLHAGARRA